MLEDPFLLFWSSYWDFTVSSKENAEYYSCSNLPCLPSHLLFPNLLKLLCPGECTGTKPLLNCSTFFFCQSPLRFLATSWPSWWPYPSFYFPHVLYQWKIHGRNFTLLRADELFPLSWAALPWVGWPEVIMQVMFHQQHPGVFIWNFLILQQCALLQGKGELTMIWAQKPWQNRVLPFQQK